MKRLKKPCYHLLLNQKLSSWLLTFLFSSEKSEKPSWFLRCREKRFLLQPQKSALELQLKNKKWQPYQLVWCGIQTENYSFLFKCWRWIVGGGEISVLRRGETHVSHARASGDIVGFGENLPKAAHYHFLNIQLPFSGVVWRSLNFNFIRKQPINKWSHCGHIFRRKGYFSCHETLIPLLRIFILKH